MNKLLTLIFISISVACFGQKKDIKLDSIKVNPFESAQIENYIKGDKAKEIAQLQERIAFLQRELQLMTEAKQVALQAPMEREGKRGQAVDFKNGYLFIQK